MKYFFVEPEVAGGLGNETVMDRAVHPPNVSRLHYNFDGWLGDVLLESFPCFIITTHAVEALEEISPSGMALENVRISKSNLFDEVNPDQCLPQFYWLKVTGKAGVDDFGLANDFRLVASERVITKLKAVGLSNALIEDF